MKHTLGLAIAAVGSIASVAAATDVYTDKNAFLNNVQPGFYLEAFTNVPVGASPPLNFGPVNGFAYTVSASTDQLFNDVGVVSTNLAGDSLVITFTGAPVTAVGGNFWATDISFGVISADIKIDLSDGTTHTYFSTAKSDFRGFISEVPITKVTIDAIDSGPFAWPTMDNLHVGVGEATGCYPDCDGDNVLSIDDFICFQTFFAFGDDYADCDGDNVLSIDDFVCFQTFFALGCNRTGARDDRIRRAGRRRPARSRSGRRVVPSPNPRPGSPAADSPHTGTRARVGRLNRGDPWPANPPPTSA